MRPAVALSRRALALAVTIRVRRNSSFSIKALPILAVPVFAVPLYLRVFQDVSCTFFVCEFASVLVRNLLSVLL